MIIIDNNKYFYSLYNLFTVSYIINILENEINHVISIIKLKNFLAIILNNVLAIASV